MRLHSFALACLVLVSSAYAQQFTAKNIVFTGYEQATKSDLLAASGLKEGSALTQQQVQSAAQQLSDTGMFSSVSFEFKNQTLNIGLSPAEGFLPVHYQNFPWWDEKTLNEQVHARVPLFHGQLPPVSKVKDQVSAALTSILAEEKHIDANIHGLLVNDPNNNPIAMGFSIELPKVALSNIAVQGVSSQESAAVEALTHSFIGERYFEGQTAKEVEAALRTHYRNQGFLDATVTTETSREASFENGEVHVPIRVTVTEGSQYRIGSLHLAGGVLMSQDDFLKYARLHPGDIANEEKLKQTIAIAASPYQIQGYLRAKISAAPTRHPEQHTVDYVINVIPGDVYHFGTVKFENLTETQRAEVLKAWKLAPGAAYDASYPVLFLKKNAAMLHTLDGYSANYTQRVNEETHIVDLILSFRKGGPLS